MTALLTGLTIEDLASVEVTAHAREIAGRAVGAYVPMPSTPGTACRHSLDDLVGYVVRVTVLDGSVIARGAERVGYDAGSYDGAGSYAGAVAGARALQGGGSWAVADRLYACGHRS